ncbi:SRP-independent ER targeting protein Snd3b [Schizosaccharomyces osmophilus]|uniref:SRP-independent ER targeting protein Snd3b n=1 Tax=Schizosaccharomyces osmophilus TaxID=2545709 RepID=A0AAF0AUQ6_9SCHI|nr:SRP-independent ER targeting protein Snd3b [Schizosaccharomyces osmophilus]WBW71598.1 SRP-independent ER targeting protein Snd3b [Schizosaccharomyces osmophilus]
MNAQVLNLVAALGVMQYSKRLDFEDPQIVYYARAAYVVSNAIIFGIYTIIQTRISSNNDRTPLIYEEPAAPFSGQSAGKHVSTTVKDYDTEQLQKAKKSSMIGVAMMAFMHLYMGYAQPLVLQSILPLISLFTNQLTSIYILGKAAEGSLARPFAAGGGPFSNANKSAPAAPAASSSTPAAAVSDGPTITELNDEEKTA